MLSELVQLNKVFKSNEFTNLRPRVYNDMVIYVLQAPALDAKGKPKPPCMAKQLVKADEA